MKTEAELRAAMNDLEWLFDNGPQSDRDTFQVSSFLQILDWVLDEDDGDDGTIDQLLDAVRTNRSNREFRT